MYDVVSLVFEIYFAAFCGYCLQYFCGSFLEYKRQERRWNGLYIAVSYTVLRLCVNLALPSDYGDTRTIGNLVLSYVIMTVLLFLFYKSAKVITGYLVITFMALTQISFFIAYSFFTFGNGLCEFWVDAWTKGYIAENRLGMITWITVVVLQVLMWVIFSILCHCSLKKIIQSFRDKEYAIQRTELIFILAPRKENVVYQGGEQF